MPSPASPPRWTEYVALSVLQRDHRNPKAHADADIAASLERFGYVEPITMDERTGTLIAGHGRLDSLEKRKASGAAAPEGVVVDDAGEWLAPVTRGWHSKDDAEAEAYLITSNHLTTKGGWELPKLAESLNRLLAGPGLEGIGFSPVEAGDLVRSFGELPSLDDLAALHGATSEKDFWPALVFKVPPALKARWEAAVARRGGESDGEHLFAWLVDLAEADLAAVTE